MQGSSTLSRHVLNITKKTAVNMQSCVCETTKDTDAWDGRRSTTRTTHRDGLTIFWYNKNCKYAVMMTNDKDNWIKLMASPHGACWLWQWRSYSYSRVKCLIQHSIDHFSNDKQADKCISKNTHSTPLTPPLESSELPVCKTELFSGELVQLSAKWSIRCHW